MSTAEVGNLRVNLAMNSADLDDGVDSAKNALDRFGNAIGITNLTWKAGIASIVAVAVAGFYKVGEAMSEAATKAGELIKLSEQIGIPFDKLSDLSIGAGIDVKQLGSTLEQLQKDITETISGKATADATRAFNAMGIAVTDATGKFKSADAVFLEISDKFASYADGAGKVALATALFGQRGIELIPILNKGSEALGEAADKAREAGSIMSEETAKAASQLKDSFSGLGVDLESFAGKLLQKVAPSLVKIVDGVQGLIEKLDLGNLAIDIMDTSFKALVTTGIIVKTVYDALSSTIANLATLMSNFLSGDFTKGIAEYDKAQTDVVNNGKKNIQEIKDLWNGPNGWGAAIEETKNTVVKAAPPVMQSIQSITDAQREFNKSVNEGVQYVQKLATPLQVYGKTLDNLGDALSAGKISAEQNAIAQQAAVYTMVNAYAGLASQVGNALASLFSNNKGVAIASALINTFEAVTKALATYPPPFSYVAAGAALAAGMAQVAKIKSTNKSGSGGGGGGSVSAGAAASTSTGPTQVPQTLTVMGINANQFYSGSAVKGIADALVDYQRNGGQVVIK